jgi:hypothetical protein
VTEDRADKTIFASRFAGNQAGPATLSHDDVRVCSPKAALLSVISARKGLNMSETHTALDQMQRSYIAAVELWIKAIKEEEALASVNHTVAEVDKWEAAHFKEDEIRNRVKSAKKQYEDALRENFYGF